MKNLIVTISCLCLFSGSSSAQTCKTIPTCESLGYDTLASNCPSGSQSIFCPFDNTKVFCSDSSDSQSNHKKAEIGDIYYYNGKPLGVIFDIQSSPYESNVNYCTIIALKNINENGIEVNDAVGTSETGMYWSIDMYAHPESDEDDWHYDIPTLPNADSSQVAAQDESGASNMEHILGYADLTGRPATAAWACFMYNPDNCTTTCSASGEICDNYGCYGTQTRDSITAFNYNSLSYNSLSWYLPAYGELLKIQKNLDVIQSALSSAGGIPLITKDSSYWSSTESASNGAWKFTFGSGSGLSTAKNTKGEVRPVKMIFC